VSAPCKLPRSFLGVSKQYDDIRVPVTEIELDHAVASGAQLRLLGENLVPLYEEHTARLEAGLDLDRWQMLDPFEKALIIAQRRIRLALENLQAEAQIKAAKRKTAKR